MKKISYLLVIISSILFSCSGDEFLNGPPRLEIHVEDAPADYDVLNVTFEGIDLKKDGEWVSINNDKQIINVLDLTGGVSKKLMDQEIPIGKYTGLRLKFAETGHSVKIFSNEHPLTIDQDKRTVELPIDIEVTSGVYYLMCDFDASKSVDETNKKLTPSVSLINFEELGVFSAILGNEKGVSLPEVMLVKFLSKDGAVHNTYVHKTRASIFSRLDEGEYTINIIPDDSSRYQAKTIENISIKRMELNSYGRIWLDTIKKKNGKN